MNLLLVMFSTELYAPPSHVAAPPPPIGMHVYLDAAMDQRDLASHAVQTLLTHFISSQAPPSSLALHDPGAPRSTFYMVRSAASSVFWLPYTAYTMLRRSGNQPVQDPSGSPVADTAVSLLLALHFYAAAPGVGAGNPYRQALRQLRDADEMGSEEAAEGGRGVAAGSPAVPYAALFDALGRALVPRESTILLLYALLHGTPHFNEYCMVSQMDFFAYSSCHLVSVVRQNYSPTQKRNSCFKFSIPSLGARSSLILTSCLLCRHALMLTASFFPYSSCCTRSKSAQPTNSTCCSSCCSSCLKIRRSP